MLRLFALTVDFNIVFHYEGNLSIHLINVIVFSVIISFRLLLHFFFSLCQSSIYFLRQRPSTSLHCPLFGFIRWFVHKTISLNCKEIIVENKNQLCTLGYVFLYE